MVCDEITSSPDSWFCVAVVNQLAAEQCNTMQYHICHHYTKVVALCVRGRRQDKRCLFFLANCFCLLANAKHWVVIKEE